MSQLLLMVNILANNTLSFKLLKSLEIMGLGLLAVVIVIGLLVGAISLVMYVDKRIADRAKKAEEENKNNE